MAGRDHGFAGPTLAEPDASVSPACASLPRSFFARPAEQVGPELLGCVLEHRLPGGERRTGVIVETEAYCQSEPACHGHRRRSPSNETLFGEPGRFYVYVSYGIHHCVNVVTGRCDQANGVLLRAAAVPGAPERLAAGPALLARHFGIDRTHDGMAATGSLLRIAPRPPAFVQWWDSQTRCGHPLTVTTTRIGIRLAQDLPWRWYLAPSRSVSRRQRGDRTPARAAAWSPDALGGL
ncbi:DNA-3-methyladenine glycosylase [Synechococcus sp. RSCCF101]|uniref:DNA-3-methyladenine glycosylase n=1 Tax=Synechococcus sp. RSCCF101 TaxID=2511069 RepID=UPI0012447412|nr:DNA-3-methyladenine glycosylase [Synechococcus sp. RSCCF101]QEY32244.1 DNA-3-methyladenine glycosylase [Synechococcus sp. RSCCF101]